MANAKLEPEGEREIQEERIKNPFVKPPSGTSKCLRRR
jgi:hypothetical protein